MPDDKNQPPARISIPIGEELLSRHMLMLGGTGTGKTNAISFVIQEIQKIMGENDIMVIFDTKGDYYKQFRKDGDIVISNSKTVDKDYWNIYNEILEDDETDEIIAEICRTLFLWKIENSRQPFFPHAAKDFLEAIMAITCRYNELKAYRNNNALRDIINSISQESLNQMLSLEKDMHGLMSYIGSEVSDQSLGILSYLQQTIREIFIGNFRKNGSLSMRRLVREKGKKVVFIEYDLGTGNILKPIYTLLFDLAIKEALSRSENSGNVYFIIDEFRLLPKLNHIDEGVNFGRSLGVKFIVGMQNIDQIIDEYGANNAYGMLSGFGTTIAFRTSDSRSRDYVKQLYGTNTVLSRFNPLSFDDKVSESLGEGYVISDEDCTKRRPGECIVSILENDPFLFKFDEFSNTAN